MDILFLLVARCSAPSRTYNHDNSSRIHRSTSKSHISLFAPTLLWLSLSLTLCPYGCQRARSSAGLNPRRLEGGDSMAEIGPAEYVKPMLALIPIQNFMAGWNSGNLNLPKPKSIIF
jgi:hypothetical protein